MKKILMIAGLAALTAAPALAHDARYSRADGAYASADTAVVVRHHRHRSNVVISGDGRSFGMDPDPAVRAELRRDAPSGYNW